MPHRLAHRSGARRALGCALSLMLGLAAAVALLLLAGQPALAAGTVRPYPGASPCDASLQACLDGALPGDTIVITAGTYITSITLSQAVSLTGIASNTVILQALPSQRVLTVTGSSVNSSVVISGLTFTGGDVTGASFPDNCGGGVQIADSAQPLLVNIIITGNLAGGGGGLCSRFPSALSLTGSLVLSNTSKAASDAGGGIVASGPTNVSGSRLQGNQCQGSDCRGGGLYINGPLTVTNSQLTSNTAQGEGGGAYSTGAVVWAGGLISGNVCAGAGCSGGGLAANSALTLTGAQFISNTAAGGGGGLRVSGAALLTSAVFQNNQCTGATCDGGAILAGGALALSNTQILTSTAGQFGGGINSGSSATVLTATLLQGNACTQAGCQGGALWAAGRLTATTTQFIHNTSASSGGALYAFDSAFLATNLFRDNQCTQSGCQGGALAGRVDLTLTGTQFLSNTAQGDGGALNGGGALTLTNTSFYTNTTHGYGGGLHASSPAVILNGRFENNQCAATAGCQGGALQTNSTLVLTGTQFVNNTAHFGGGAVWLGTGTLTNALFQNNTCLVNDSSNCYGGGLYSVFGLTLTNVSFLTNSALARAGGAFANGPAVLSGGLFQNNTCTQAACHGGALLAADTLALADTQFLTNAATSDGGALEAIGTMTMTHGLFRGNSCSETGCQAGALRAGTLALSGTQFFHNQSSGGGGAATVDSAAIAGALFQDNSCAQAACSGGALLGGITVALTNTQFLSNTAGQRGGGAFINNAAQVSGGKFQGNQCTVDDCEGGGLYASGTLALSGTQFIGNFAHKHGGGAYALGAASLSGGLFQHNQCTQADCQGGGLSVFNGTPLTLTNMTFLSNTALVQGGGVNALGSAAISGGLFQGNSCTQVSCTAGGLYVNGTLALSGTQVISNLSRLSGAGVLANGGGALTNGLFQNNACNQADCHGGGLSAGGALAVTNTQFINNASFSHGGGVYVGAAGAVSVSGGQFQGNQCTQTDCTGGGLYEISNLALTAVDFVGNLSRSDGGGVYAGGDAVITNGRFQDNHCSQDECQGGGLHGQNNLTLSGTQFISNSARFSAGGVYANAGALAVLNGGLFQGNICSQTGCRGGGINVNGSIALTGTQFIGNAAVFDGGGLRTAGPATVVRAVFKGNSAFEGGGFYHAGAAGSVVNTLFVSNLAAGGGEDVYVNGAGGAFNLLHDTIGVPLGVQTQPAVQVAAGSVGITNTLFFYHDTAIARTGGMLYEDYNLFAQVGISVTGGASGGTHSHYASTVDLDNPTANDYHLAAGSKAIDAGVNAGVFIDFEGQPRPLGNGFDIGYDEALLNRVYLPVVRRP